MERDKNKIDRKLPSVHPLPCDYKMARLWATRNAANVSSSVCLAQNMKLPNQVNSLVPLAGLRIRLRHWASMKQKYNMSLLLCALPRHLANSLYVADIEHVNLVSARTTNHNGLTVTVTIHSLPGMTSESLSLTFVKSVASIKNENSLNKIYLSPISSIVVLYKSSQFSSAMNNFNGSIPV